ncbi:MAG: DUF4012 domain-containing protein [bacterium]
MSNKTTNKHKIPESNVLDLRNLPKQAPSDFNTNKKQATEDQGPGPGEMISLLWQDLKSNTSRVFNRRVMIALSAFVLVSLVISTPFFASGMIKNLTKAKGQVLAASTEAFSHLQEAGDYAVSYNFNDAQQSFGSALQEFDRAEEILTGINGILFTITKHLPFTGSSIKSGEALIIAGKEMSMAGQLFSQSIQALTSQNTIGLDVTDKTSIGLALDIVETNLIEIGPHVRKAAQELDKVKVKDVPENYQDTISTVKNQLPALMESYEKIEKTAQTLIDLIGSKEDKQYLLIFQNSNELRATGGFMGSFALASVKSGQIRILDVPGRGFLDLNHANLPKLIPPKPMWLVNNQWQAQDANWWPDWPTSARKINWFYEQSRGYVADGIIALTPQVIEDLLKLTGPIHLPEFGITVNSESLTDVLQENVEITYDKELNKPKQIIGELMTAVLNEIFLLPTEKIIEAGSVLTQSLTDRDLLIYSNNQSIQERVIDLGWGGQMMSVPADYLMVVDTNIGGGKTDGIIHQTIEHDVEIDDQGIATVRLKLIRENFGDKEDPWTKMKNVSYLRVYVPEGCEFVSAEGFNSIGESRIKYPESEAQIDPDINESEGSTLIDEYSGTRIGRSLNKTVFGNWLETSPGEKVEATLTYRLPFNFKNEQQPRYSLYVQVQPGAKNRYFRSELNYPEWLDAQWTTPQDSTLIRIGRSVHYTSTLTKDLSYGVLFENKN